MLEDDFIFPEHKKAYDNTSGSSLSVLVLPSFVANNCFEQHFLSHHNYKDTELYHGNIKESFSLVGNT